MKRIESGDYVEIIGNERYVHHFAIGSVVEVESVSYLGDEVNCRGKEKETGEEIYQTLCFADVKLLDTVVNLNGEQQSLGEAVDKMTKAFEESEDKEVICISSGKEWELGREFNGANLYNFFAKEGMTDYLTFSKSSIAALVRHIVNSNVLTPCRFEIREPFDPLDKIKELMKVYEADRECLTAVEGFKDFCQHRCDECFLESLRTFLKEEC